MHHFFASTHLHGNVVLSFTPRPIDDLEAFALGYREAGKNLANQMAAAKGYADYDGYPILFLYRHALELYLKAIVYRGARLVGLISPQSVNTEKLFHRHSLAPLLPSIQAIFKQMNWNFEGSGLASYDDFADFVRGLDEIDPGSYAFRYPIDRSGQAHLPHHFVLNVVEFAGRMDTLLEFLEGAATGIGEEWRAELEAQHELQRWVEEWQGE
jgi:hypothetical protein